MTNNKLLDIILKMYLMDRHWELSENPLHQKLTFSKIAKSQDPTIEEWRIKFLKDQLFSDKFLEYAKYGDEEPYTLTSAGIKAAQIGWYVPMETNRILDKETKEQNLKNLKRSKAAIIISILAIIIPTLISLYILFTNKQQTTQEQFQELQRRVQKLESKKIEVKPTSKALETLGSDASRMNFFDKSSK